MKRYNIHLDEARVEEIDKILAKIKALAPHHWGVNDLTRADLIRFAIAETFDLRYYCIHGYNIDLAKVIKKAIKVKGPSKSV